MELSRTAKIDEREKFYALKGAFFSKQDSKDYYFLDDVWVLKLTP